MEEDYSDEGKSELNDIIFWINQSKVKDISELHESLKRSNLPTLGIVVNLVFQFSSLLFCDWRASKT